MFTGTVLIVEPDIDSALDLQDRLGDAGVHVVTAYRLERALNVAQTAGLIGVVVDSSVYDQSAELRDRLRERNIPHIVKYASVPLAAVVSDLCGLIPSSVMSDSCCRPAIPNASKV